MLNLLKEKIKNGKYTANAYTALYKLLFGGAQRKENKIRLEAMHKNGVETIKSLQEILSTTGLVFFFDMGTLLGIIREGKLLGHDLDIDVAVFANDEQDIERLYDVLKANGCQRKYSYVAEDIGVIEDSFLINGIKFDVNYYRNSGDKSICYLAYIESYTPENKMNTVELSCSKIEEITETSFGGVMVNIPKNAEIYLSERYGNWRVPDKNYRYWRGPSTRPIPNLCEQIKN